MCASRGYALNETRKEHTRPDPPPLDPSASVHESEARAGHTPVASFHSPVSSYAPRSSTWPSIVPISGLIPSSGRHPCRSILVAVSKRVHCSSCGRGSGCDAGPISRPDRRSISSQSFCMREARYQAVHTAPHRASCAGDVTNDNMCSSSSGASKKSAHGERRGEPGATGAACRARPAQRSRRRRRRASGAAGRRAQLAAARRCGTRAPSASAPSLARVTRRAPSHPRRPAG